MAYKRPDAVPVDGRNAIALKCFIRELALILDHDDVVSVAHAAGTDRSALRLKAELEARTLRKAETEHQA